MCKSAQDNNSIFTSSQFINRMIYSEKATVVLELQTQPLIS